MNLRKTIASILSIITCLSGPYSLHGQSPCSIDVESPMCIITQAVIKGDLESGGTHVFFPEVAIDACSEVRTIDIYTFPDKKVFISGDYLPCGSHNFQAIVADSNDNMTICDFKITIKCQEETTPMITSVPEISNHDDYREIGALSALWESGGMGPGTISGDNGDPGGKSYGTFQISSNHGYLENFLNNEGKGYKALFEGVELLSPEFDSIWRLIAITDREEFEQQQKDFIARTHYQVFARRVKKQLGMDISKYPPVVKEVIWSTVVQHGPYNNVLNFALAGMDLEVLSEKTIIELIYKERGLIKDGRLYYYPRTDSNWQKNLIQRFNKEKNQALSKL